MIYEKIAPRLRSFLTIAIAIVGVVIINFGFSSAVLAGDSYNAAMDTVQATRNPNRVDSSIEEIKNAKVNVPDEDEGEDSIYDRLVDKVDKKNKEAMKDSKSASNTRSR